MAKTARKKAGKPAPTPVKLGRPSLFRPEYVKAAEAICKLGLTDIELAEVFDVSVRTIHRWKVESEDFCHALTIGKEHADNRVKRSLYEKAVGFGYTEQEAIKLKVSQYEEKVEVVTVERRMPADTAAAIFWLKNRDPSEWRDKVEHTGVLQIERQPFDLRNLAPEQRELFRQLLIEAAGKLEEPDVIEGEYEARGR